MKKTTNRFKVFRESTASHALEQALKEGNDIVLIGSPSAYFDPGAGKTALWLMRKFPARKIFVTDPVSESVFEEIRAKAAEGASLPETCAYAEKLSVAGRA